MLNKVILIGEIVSDPELRYFKDGSVITILNIMTKEKVNNILQKNWHRVVINKKNKEVKKNMLVIINGKIKTRKWLNNKNKYNYITEIIVEEIKEIKIQDFELKDYNKNDIKIKNDNYNEYNLEKDKNEIENEDLENIKEDKNIKEENNEENNIKEYELKENTDLNKEKLENIENEYFYDENNYE